MMRYGCFDLFGTTVSMFPTIVLYLDGTQQLGPVGNEQRNHFGKVEAITRSPGTA